MSEVQNVQIKMHTVSERALAHLQQHRRVALYTIHGHQVVVAATPKVEWVSAPKCKPVLRRSWVIKATGGGPSYGDSAEDTQPFTVEIGADTHIFHDISQQAYVTRVMKYAARRWTMRYLNRGRGVRGNGYVGDAFQRWIGSKRPGMGRCKYVYKLQDLVKSGDMGSTQAKGETWLR